MKLKEFIVEVGDKPYAMPSKWERDYDGAYSSYSKTINLPDGQLLSINFDYENEEKFANINFYVDHSQEITGQGDAYKILSTVTHQLVDFVKKHRPNVLMFRTSGEASRDRLYARMVLRFLGKAPFTNYENISPGSGYRMPNSLEWFIDDVQASIDKNTTILANRKWIEYNTYYHGK